MVRILREVELVPPQLSSGPLAGTEKAFVEVTRQKQYHLCVKTTRYFREQVLRRRPYLKEEWIERVLNNPMRKEVQPDDRVRYWGSLKSLENIFE